MCRDDADIPRIEIFQLSRLNQFHVTRLLGGSWVMK